jgi:hypothetical protein
LKVPIASPALQALVEEGHYTFDPAKQVGRDLAEVGSALGRKHIEKDPDVHPAFDYIASLYPHMTVLQMPDASPSSARLYLKNNDDRADPVEVDLTAEFDDLASRLNYRIRPLIDRHTLHLPANIFLALTETVNRDATPGYPFNLQHATKGECLDARFPEIYNMVQERLRLLAFSDPRVVEQLTAVEMVQQGYCDPKYIIVKREGTKPPKIVSNTCRVVQAASIVDELVSKALEHPVFKAVLADKARTFSLLGMALSGTDAEAVLDAVAATQGEGELSANDAQAFEFSHSRSAIRSSHRFSAVMMQCLGTPLATALDNYALCMSLSLFVFKDGVLWAQTRPRNMKSGVPGTSTHNTLIRHAIYHRAGGTGLCLSSSDDTLERRFPGAVEAYASLGYVIKDYDQDTRSSFECCSHYWRQGLEPVAKNVEKSFFNLLHNFSKEACEAFQALHYRDSAAMTCLSVLLSWPVGESEQI